MEELRQCITCGGTGIKLTKKEGKCLHCMRIESMIHRPAECKWCTEGYFDMSPKCDGGIHKKLIREGEGTERPVDGCPTFVQFVGRLENGDIFETTRMKIDDVLVGGTDDPFELQVGRNDVVIGWDLGIQSMKKGELSTFVIQPQYAYGAAGYPPKVRPDVLVIYEVELISWKDALPRFPSKSEIAESERLRAEEEAQSLKDHPPPSTAERALKANEEKDKGNALFAKKEYEEAQKCYDTAFVHLFISKEELEMMSEEEKKLLQSTKVPLHLNRGMCKLKQQKWDDAMWDCNCALEIDKFNVKGYYRRGFTYVGLLSTLLEKEAAGLYWDIEKAKSLSINAHQDLKKAIELSKETDPAVKLSLEQLHKHDHFIKVAEAKYAAEQKHLYRDKIIGGLSAAAKREATLAKYAASGVSEYDDLPTLEDT